MLFHSIRSKAIFFICYQHKQYHSRHISIFSIPICSYKLIATTKLILQVVMKIPILKIVRNRMIGRHFSKKNVLLLFSIY